MKKILLSSVVALAILTGCSEEKVEEKKEVVVEESKKVETPVEVKTPESKFVDQIKDSTVKVATQIVEESKKLAEIGGEAVKSVSEKVAITTEEVVNKTKEVTDEVVAAATETKDKIEQSLDTIVTTKTQAEETSDDLAVKGKALYLKCSGCHGPNGEKVALGKSKVIAGWTKEETISSLKGYKDGTYGGVMKGVMKGQVINLSDEEIEALSVYISTFK